MKSPVFLLLAFMILPVALAWEARDTPPSTLPIAVVDVSRLIKEHREYSEDEQRLELWQSTQQEELDRKTKELEDLGAELESYRPDSDEFLKRRMELDVTQYSLNKELDSLNKQLGIRRAKALAAAYQRVEDACEKALESGAYELILQYNPNPVLGASIQMVASEIVPRTVLAHRGNLDITEEVLSILNAP